VLGGLLEVKFESIRRGQIFVSPSIEKQRLGRKINVPAKKMKGDRK
jgi:hypothetical protein